MKKTTPFFMFLLAGFVLLSAFKEHKPPSEERYIAFLIEKDPADNKYKQKVRMEINKKYIKHKRADGRADSIDVKAVKALLNEKKNASTGFLHSSLALLGLSLIPGSLEASVPGNHALGSDILAIASTTDCCPWTTAVFNGETFSTYASFLSSASYEEIMSQYFMRFFSEPKLFDVALTTLATASSYMYSSAAIWDIRDTLVEGLEDGPFYLLFVNNML